MELKDKVVLVTGGGTGLGREICLAFARRGAGVAVNYSRAEIEAEKVASEAREIGVRAIAVRADVSDQEEVEEMVAKVMSEFGRIDVLVNNAGITRYVPLRDLHGVKPDDWDRIMAVNVKGAFLCSQAVADHMVARGSGKIVNTASNSAFIPSGSSIPYMASKAALVSVTKSLAAALSPHVQVNAVAPGYLPIGFMDKYFPKDVRNRLLQNSEYPPAAVEDVVSTIMLLASADSVTGQTVVIDHGRFMH